MRAVTVQGSILLTPIRAPSESEYRDILKAAGRPSNEPREAEKRIKDVLRKVRARGRRA